MTKKTDIEDQVRVDFARDTAHHEMGIVHDHGVYRHLRFRQPGTGVFGFDIVTWPGHLAISGDMGSAVFSRLHDMMDFFRIGRAQQADQPSALYINAGYWAEKCVANDGEKKEFRRELFKDFVADEVRQFIEGETDDNEPPVWAEELREAINDDVLVAVTDTTHQAVEALDNFTHEESGFRFVDAWDSATCFEHYTHHFIWRLLAIAHAVKTYDAAKAEAPVEVSP